MWLAFLAYVFSMTYTPGPINIISMNNAIRLGFKQVFVFNLGTLTGTVMIMTLCMIFSLALYSAVATIEIYMKSIGAAYMIYLAYQNLQHHKLLKIKHKGSTYTSGVLLQFVNAKLVAFGLTAMSTYILPYYDSAAILMLFVLLIAIVQFSANIAWTLFGSLFAKLFKQHGKTIGVVMALLLLYCAVSLFL